MNNKPFKLPDYLADIINVGETLSTVTPDAVEAQIIEYISNLHDKVVTLFDNLEIAMGDAAVVRSALQYIQRAQSPLFKSASTLPETERLNALSHLHNLIVGATIVGSFVSITRTTTKAVRRGNAKAATQAAKESRSPKKGERQELVREFWERSTIKAPAHITRRLAEEGHKFTAKTVRQNLKELGLFKK
jgi:hypothetical protein